MTKLTQYAEAFWDQDFVSTAGYDVLSKHNGEGKKFLQDFEEYLRKRSKMELEFSKSLNQLSRSLKNRTTVGVLEAAWNTLHGELDACRESHEQAGLFFTQQAEETRRFCKEVTARRDSAEERLKKMQQQKSSQFKTVTSLSKTYRQKCREKDTAKDQYDILRREVTSTVKELDRARSKKDKTDDDANKADNAYKNGILTLEDIRQEWEREMELACKEFQSSDEEQIMFLRWEMWQAVNKLSQVAVDVDESCERVRNVLENCEVDLDIQSFIAYTTTGTERPRPVVYQNYYDTGGVSAESRDDNQRSGSASSADSHHRLPAPLPTLGNHGSSAFYSVAHVDADDPTYASADATYSMADAFPDQALRQLTISKSFQSPPNFAVQVGEKVIFVRKVTSNVVEVKTHSNKVGNVPLTCIKESV